MQVQQKQVGSKGLFYVKENDNIMAKMTYSMTGTDLMIIDHTEVSEELKGKNVGYQLVQAAVEYARTNHIKIFPLCPFANAVFKKKAAEYGDVLSRN